MTAGERTKSRWWHRVGQMIVIGLLIALIFIVFTMLGLSVFRAEETWRQADRWLDVNAERLLFFRLTIYAVISFGLPPLVLWKIAEPAVRGRYIRQFMMVFVVFFTVGELVVVQNVFGRLFF